MKVMFLWMLLTAFIPFTSFATEKNSAPELVVQEVQCRGNDSTSCSFITGYLYLNPGDAVNEEEIQNAKLRLSSLTNFTSVDIRLEKGSEKGNALIVIEVAEASPYAKEILLGTVLQNSSFTQKAFGRLSHQNLFGTGKILEFEIGGRIPLNQNADQEFSARLQFVDPTLFGSSKYFLVSGVSYSDQSRKWSPTAPEMSNIDASVSSESHSLGVDVSVGRRFGDFSYVTGTFKHSPTDSRKITFQSGKTNEVDFYSRTSSGILGYGWNSEDDAYFPTQGSRFNAAYTFPIGEQHGNWAHVGLAYRTTWTTAGNSNWTFRIGGTPGTEYRPTSDEEMSLSLAFARPLPKGIFEGINRGRWFVEPGFNGIGYSTSAGYVFNPGLKAGVRFEHKTFGLVSLYALASKDMNFGGSR